MTQGAVSRPLPLPTPDTEPYWQAAASGQLALARCARCRCFSHPPGPICPHCGSTEPGFTFEMVEAGGRVRSWTVQNRAFLGGFAEDVPFMLVDVEMDLATEQPEVRLIGRLLDGPDATISLGDAVEVAFEEIGGGFSVPAFRLAGPASRLASQ